MGARGINVVTKTGTNKPAHHYHIMIDTGANKPVITHDDIFDWEHKDHGTSVEIEMEAVYKGGRRSVDEYIQQVTVANPHVRLEYYAPGKRPVIYPRITERMPPETKEIKPHPYGVELGVLQRMAGMTCSRTIGGFLQAEFSRVSSTIAEEICKNAKVSSDTSLKDIGRVEIECGFGGSLLRWRLLDNSRISGLLSGRLDGLSIGLLLFSGPRARRSGQQGEAERRHGKR